jgi:hypothetical protein
MQYAGYLAISVTVLTAPIQRNALVPLLVAGATLDLGGERRGVELGLVTPQRIEDATQPPR